eukprot:3517968-Rhodomonas_salina.3
MKAREGEGADVSHCLYKSGLEMTAATRRAPCSGGFEIIARVMLLPDPNPVSHPIRHDRSVTRNITRIFERRVDSWRIRRVHTTLQHTGTQQVRTQGSERGGRRADMLSWERILTADAGSLTTMLSAPMRSP